MIEIVDIFDSHLVKKPSALALGLFDGVHIGHKVLLEKTVGTAKERGLLPAVFTFRSTGYKQAPTLFSRESTYRQMEEIGIKRIYEADFSRVAGYSPKDFVETVLREICFGKILVFGDNFRFGKGAEGDAKMLKALFSLADEQVIVVPPVKIEDKVVSSSLVREALVSGDIESANLYLGFPYHIEGEIKRGKALGRKLQFPTINLEFSSGFAVPKRGVYVSLAEIGGKAYPGISNIGVRPTVEDTKKENCETHLLHADGDFYGQEVKVSLFSLLREEKQFESLEALALQIQKDTKQAKEWFSAHSEICEKFSIDN